jgi:predicted nucleic acid-binding protein
MLTDEIDLPADHMLLAPTLLRSQVLDDLYRQVRDGHLPEVSGIDRLAVFAGMKIRYLGDKVLRRKAWSVADQLGWDGTGEAEYVALTILQADALITLDERVAREASSLVTVAPIDVIL